MQAKTLESAKLVAGKLITIIVGACTSGLMAAVAEVTERKNNI